MLDKILCVGVRLNFSKIYRESLFFTIVWFNLQKDVKFLDCFPEYIYSNFVKEFSPGYFYLEF